MLALALLLTVSPAAAAVPSEAGLLDFRYVWPAEVDAIPALRAMLRRQRAAAHADALANARESRGSARDAHVPFYTEMHHQIWSVEARNAHFLSLTADIRTDQNGAHPNRDFAALVWDRARNRATNAAALLGSAALTRMSARYCAALGAQVAAHGGEPPSRCPPLVERVLSFSDADHDGRFDALHVLIAPYVAASYADGSFVVDIQFDRGDLDGVAAADRDAFEAEPGR